MSNSDVTRNVKSILFENFPFFSRGNDWMSRLKREHGVVQYRGTIFNINTRLIDAELWQFLPKLRYVIHTWTNTRINNNFTIRPLSSSQCSGRRIKSTYILLFSSITVVGTTSWPWCSVFHFSWFTRVFTVLIVHITIIFLVFSLRIFTALRVRIFYNK